MSAVDEAGLRAAAEAATPGPWRCDPEQERPSRPADCYDVIDDFTLPVVGSIPHADATFIAAANPTAVLALLDELGALRAMRDRVAALPDEWEATSPAWIDPVYGPACEVRAALGDVGRGTGGES